MDNDKTQRDEPEGGEPEQGQEHAFGELRHYVPAEILNVSFPGAVRGYDRRAVDAHIKRVNRLIAEIKVSSSTRMLRRTPPRPRARSFSLTRKLRQRPCSRTHGQWPKTSSFAPASRQRTSSRLREVKPMSAVSSSKPSSPLCEIRRRGGCASSRPTPPAFGSSVVSCSSRCAVWPAGSSIWPMRQLNESPTSRTCSRHWNQRRKLKQNRNFPTPTRPTRQCR